MDPSLVVGVMLIAGALVRVAPGPLAASALGALAVLRIGGGPRPSPWLLAVALLALAVGATRSIGAIHAHEAARAAAWSALPAPARCSADAIVVSSPTESHGILRWDADLAAVSCDGRDLPIRGPVRASLYGGAADSARG